MLFSFRDSTTCFVLERKLIKCLRNGEPHGKTKEDEEKEEEKQEEEENTLDKNLRQIIREFALETLKKILANFQ